jgi:hypothetical protein
LQDVGVGDGKDIQAFWHARAHMFGNTTWVARGVSYDVVQGEPHPAWHG